MAVSYTHLDVYKRQVLHMYALSLECAVVTLVLLLVLFLLYFRFSPKDTIRCV